MLNPVQVGGIRIAVPLALAPMAGVTNWPFRLLCSEQGCGLTTTEFVNDLAILHGNRRTVDHMELFPGESPVAVQIFGSQPETMAAAARRVVEAIGPNFIDINMGCPAPKITRGRGGSSLLREPGSATAVVAAVVQAVAPVPVTVKMRIGWDRQSINAVEVARQVESAGAAMITVHGRTREQHYRGEADWETISAVTRAVAVPVFGNGDIATPADALIRLRTTGVAGLAIGRGAMGNPWLFRAIRHLVVTGTELPAPTADERVAMALRHLDLMIACKGEFVATREMRKHAAWYLKGLCGAAEARQRVNKAESAAAMRRVLTEFLAFAHVSRSDLPGEACLL